MNEYVKTAWVNGQAPALSADNLNKIESGIKAVTDKVLELEANMPDDLGDLTNSAGYIKKYTASSAPPSTAVTACYDVPCLWFYNNRIWYVYDRTETPDSTPQTYTYSYKDVLVQHQDISGKADLEDIPDDLSELTNSVGYVRKYEASAAPPSSATSTRYTVPCLWMYDGRVWFVYAMTQSGSGGASLFTYSKVELILQHQDISTKMDLADYEDVIVPADSTGHKPNTSSSQFAALPNGQMFYCAIDHGVDSFWVKKSGSSCIRLSNPSAYVPAISGDSGLSIVDFRQFFIYDGNIYLRTSSSDAIGAQTRMATYSDITDVLGDIETLLSEI